MKIETKKIQKSINLFTIFPPFSTRAYSPNHNLSDLGRVKPEAE